MAHVYEEEGRRAAGAPANAADGQKIVFLIGDSIRMGFLPYAQGILQKEALLVSPEENCRYTQYTYTSLSAWKSLVADPDAVSLIYWNNGHWDIAHWDGDGESLNSVEQYTSMLERICHRLRRYFPNAKIIFATTSPANPNGIMGVNPRNNAEISRYNQAAKHVMDTLGVQVDDVYAFLRNWDADQYADYVHLTDDGFRILGEHVAEVIREALQQSISFRQDP